MSRDSEGSTDLYDGGDLEEARSWPRRAWWRQILDMVVGLLVFTAVMTLLVGVGEDGCRGERAPRVVTQEDIDHWFEVGCTCEDHLGGGVIGGGVPREMGTYMCPEMAEALAGEDR